MPYRLFLTEIKVDWRAFQVPTLANLVFEVAFVWVLDPLWQIAEEHERRNARLFEHGHIFYLHHLALSGWWWICADDFLHGVVELRCGNDALAVLIHLDCLFQHLVDALLGERRAEDDGEVGEWRKALANGILHIGD